MRGAQLQTQIDFFILFFFNSVFSWRGLSFPASIWNLSGGLLGSCWELWGYSGPRLLMLKAKAARACVRPAGARWYGCVSLNPQWVVWARWRWRWLSNYFFKIRQYSLLAFYGVVPPPVPPPNARHCWFDDCWVHYRPGKAFSPLLIPLHFCFCTPLTESNLSVSDSCL